MFSSNIAATADGEESKDYNAHMDRYWQKNMGTAAFFFLVQYLVLLIHFYFSQQNNCGKY